jgi:hypothetical protein
VLDALTVPERALRLLEQHDTDAALPSLRQALARITEAVWRRDAPDDAYRAELQRTVQQVWTDVLLNRAHAARTSPAVQARFEQHLRTLRTWLAAHPGSTPEAEAHRATLQAAVARFLDRPADAAPRPASVDAPPGSPIGQSTPTYQRRHAERRSWLQHQRPVPRMCVRQRP